LLCKMRGGDFGAANSLRMRNHWECQVPSVQKVRHSSGKKHKYLSSNSVRFPLKAFSADWRAI
jgi:hypothetical protein